MEAVKHTQGQWVTFNPITQCYETQDRTSVAAELADNVECLADVLKIAAIRGAQRNSGETN